MQQVQTKLKINKLPHSEVEIEGEIEARLLDLAKKEALKRLGTQLNLAGFRQGHIPEKIVEEKVGEHRLLEESAEVAINKVLPEIFAESKIEPIGRPSVSIIKLAFGNPLIFKLKTAVLPEFKLPDYKNVKPKSVSELVEVNDKEIEEVLLQVRKNKAHLDWHKANPTEQDHSKHPDFEKEENLPPLDDALALSAGNFKNLEEMKEKVRENILQDKKSKEIDKKRALMLEGLIGKTEIELPEILIESEIEKSLAQMKDDIVRIGGKWEDYLTHTKKTDEDLKKDLRGDSEKKAKIQLIFNKIAEAENLQPDKEILENEVKKILEMYPEAKENNVRIYVATQLLNSEVLKLLEK